MSKLTVTAKELQDMGGDILRRFDENPDAVRAFSEEMLDQMGRANKLGTNSGIAYLMAIAHQLPGELEVESYADILKVFKGPHFIGTIEAIDDADSTHLTLGFRVTLSRVGAAIYEADCPCHTDEAKQELELNGITLNLKPEN